MGAGGKTFHQTEGSVNCNLSMQHTTCNHITPLTISMQLIHNTGQQDDFTRSRQETDLRAGPTPSEQAHGPTKETKDSTADLNIETPH